MKVTILLPFRTLSIEIKIEFGFKMNANVHSRSFPAFSGEMYFYYREFVIKQPLPEYYRTFQDIDDESGYENYHLIFSDPEPVYSKYKSKFLLRFKTLNQTFNPPSIALLTAAAHFFFEP